MVIIATMIGWACLLYSALSFFWAVTFGIAKSFQERQSAEREAIGWAIAAALFWLVAK